MTLMTNDLNDHSEEHTKTNSIVVWYEIFLHIQDGAENKSEIKKRVKTTEFRSISDDFHQKGLKISVEKGAKKGWYWGKLWDEKARLWSFFRTFVMSGH